MGIFDPAIEPNKGNENPNAKSENSSIFDMFELDSENNALNEDTYIDPSLSERFYSNPDRDVSNALKSEDFQSDIINMWNSFAKGIDHTQASTSFGKLDEHQKIVDENHFKLQDLEEKLSLGKISPDDYSAATSEIEAENNEALKEISDFQENIDLNKEEAEDSYVSKIYQMKEAAVQAKGGDAGLWESLKYAMPTVAGSSASLMGQQLAVTFGAELAKKALTAAAAGAVGGPAGSAIATVGTLGAAIGTIYNARLQETFSEAGGQLEQNQNELTRRWYEENPGKEPTEDDMRKIRMDARKGIDKFKEDQMKLAVIDGVQAILMPGSKVLGAFKAGSKFNKAAQAMTQYNRGTRAANLGGKLYGGYVGEKYEEGLQFATGKRQESTALGLGEYEDDEFMSSFMQDSYDALNSISYGPGGSLRGDGRYADDKEFQFAEGAGGLMSILPGSISGGLNAAQDINRYRDTVKDLKSKGVANTEEKFFRFKDRIYAEHFKNNNIHFLLEGVRVLGDSKNEKGIPYLTENEVAEETKNIKEAFNIYTETEKHVDDMIPEGLLAMRNSEEQATKIDAFKNAVFHSSMEMARNKKEFESIQSIANIDNLINHQEKIIASIEKQKDNSIVDATYNLKSRLKLAKNKLTKLRKSKAEIESSFSGVEAEEEGTDIGASNKNKEALIDELNLRQTKEEHDELLKVKDNKTLNEWFDKDGKRWSKIKKKVATEKKTKEAEVEAQKEEGQEEPEPAINVTTESNAAQIKSQISKLTKKSYEGSDVDTLASTIMDSTSLNAKEKEDFMEDLKTKKEELDKAEPDSSTSSSAKVINDGLPEDTQELFPRVYNVGEQGKMPYESPSRKAMSPEIAGAKEISVIIENLRSQGKDINDYVTLKGVSKSNAAGKKTKYVQVVLDGKPIGYLHEGEHAKPGMAQIASQIKAGQELTNQETKDLGFGIQISGGLISVGTEPITLDKLSIDKSETNGHYAVYDQGIKTDGKYQEAAKLLTPAMNAGEHTLPEHVKQFGRYVLAVKDNSGNWRHIPVYPSKLAKLKESLVDEYFDKLKNKIDSNKGKISTDEVDTFNADLNEGVYIAINKDLIKKSNVDGVMVDFEINTFGDLRVRVESIDRVDAEDKSTKRNDVVMKASEVAKMSTMDEMLAAINAEIPLGLSRDSFRKSISKKATVKGFKGTEFSTLTNPEVFTGQKVYVTSNETQAAANTVEPTIEPTAESTSIEEIEARRHEELARAKENNKKLNIPQESQDSIELQINQEYDLEVKAFNIKLESTSSKKEEAKLSPVEEANKRLDEGDPGVPIDDNDSLFKTSPKKVVSDLLGDEETEAAKSIVPKGITVKDKQTRSDLEQFISNVNKNRTVWGFFRNKIIYLAKGAGQGTALHEAFHAIFRYGLTDEEVKQYLSLANKEVVKKFSSEEIQVKLNTLKYESTANANLSDSQLYSRFLEEYMADEYASKSNVTATGLKRLYIRLKNLVKALLPFNNDLDALYGRIDSGEFAKRQATKNMVDSEVVYKNIPSSKTTVMTQSKSKKVINTYAAQVAAIGKRQERFRGKDKSETIDNLFDQRIEVLTTKSAEYVDSLEEGVKKERLKDALAGELYALQNPVARRLIKDEVLKKLKTFSVSEVEDQDGTETENSGNAGFGSKDAWSLSLGETLPKQIREYISFAMYKDIDELTGEEAEFSVDADVIYNGMSHALANTAEDDIVNKWIAYAQDNAQSKALLDMIMSDTGMTYADGKLVQGATKNLNDLRKIIVAFKRSKVEHSHTEFTPTFTSNGILTGVDVKSYNANLNTPDKIQMNLWANSLQNIQQKENPSNKEWKARIDAVWDSLRGPDVLLGSKSMEEIDALIGPAKDALKKLGIALSGGFIRHTIISLRNEAETSSDQEKEYLSQWPEVDVADLDILNDSSFGLLSQLSAGSTGIYSTSGIRGRLTKWAVSNAKFDESIGSSNFKGADGNTRHDIILPSYAITETLKFRDKAHRDFLKEKYEILKDNIFIDNESLMASLQLGIVGGVRDHTKGANNEGKVFGDYSEREYLVQHLSYWFARTGNKAKVLFRQNEASKTAYTAEMPVKDYYDGNKITDAAIDTIYTFFNQEYKRIGREFAKGVDGDIKGYNDSESGRAFRFTEFSDLYTSIGGAKFNEIIESARSGKELSEADANIVKGAIKTRMASSMSEFKDLLQENNFGIFKGGSLSTNKLLPGRVGKGDTLTNSEITSELNNMYINDYINSFGLNQLLDGDYALSRNDKGVKTIKHKGVEVVIPKAPIQVDIVKRNRGAMGSGPDMGSGTHRVAFIKDVFGYVDGTPKDGKLTRVNKGDANAKEINSNDAQSYNNINHIMFMAERLGRYDKNIKDILRKIRRGVLISKTEQKDLQDGQVSLNPKKTVTFGREYYIKTSEALLDRHQVSYITDKAKYDSIMDAIEKDEDSLSMTTDKMMKYNEQLVDLYQPLRGQEQFHHILNQMDLHAIDQVVAESASKGMTKTPVDSSDLTSDFSSAISDIPNSYKKLQQENPTGKKEITSGTQLIQLIDSEQNDEEKVSYNGKEITIGQLRKEYREKSATIRGNSFRIATKLLKVGEDGSLDSSRLQRKFMSSLEKTGADEQLTELFQMNWNLLPVIDKAEQLFLSHFSGGVLAQKVNGTKVSLMSDSHVEVVIDEDGNIVKNREIKKNPSKYEGYKTRKLEFNKRDPKTGKVYSEAILSENVLTKYGLEIGDEIPENLLEMLGYRIPTQDKHSMISIRVVDFMPIHMEGTGIFPQELVYLSGADFDIDSLFIQAPSFWMKEDGDKSVPVKYGEEKTDEERWQSYMAYILNDKNIRLDIARRADFGEDFTEEEYFDLTAEEKDYLNNQYVKASLSSFGLPKNKAEFLKETREINNNILNNQILEAELKLLTNESMLKDIAYTPVSDGKLVDTANKILKLKGEDSNIEYSSSSLLGKYKAFSQATAGSKGIGIAANSLQGFTFLAKNKLNRTSENAIVVNGVELDEFKYSNIEGNRIADILSSVLSIMTDNGNNPVAGKLGLSSELLPTYAYLISLGVTEESAALLINIPIIQRYSKLMKEDKFGIQSHSEKYITMKSKVNDMIKGELGIDVGKDTFESMEDSIEISDETTEGIIKTGTTKENAEMQLALLYKFMEIQDEAMSVRDLNNIIKLTKGFETSFDKVDNSLIQSIYKLGLGKMFNLPPSTTRDVSSFDVAKAVREDSLLFNNIEIALSALRKANGVFITENPQFKREYNTLIANLKDNIKPDEKSKAKRNLLGFISTKAYIKRLSENYSKRGLEVSELTMNDSLLYSGLIEGKRTLADQLIDMQNSDNEFIRENAFVKWLQAIKREEGSKQIIDKVSGKSFIKLSKDSVNDIMNAYKDLFNNPETRDFAVMSFNYLLIKDNFEFKSDSFIKYIGSFMFNNMSASLTDITNAMYKGESLEDILGMSMPEASKEFREIYNTYAPNYKNLEIKKSIKVGIKEFSSENKFIKALAISDNSNTLQFDVQGFEGLDSALKNDNLAYLAGLFDNRFDVDQNKPLYKFPEYMIIRLGNESRIYKTDLPAGKAELWSDNTTYKFVRSHGIQSVSPFGGKTLEEIHATQELVDGVIDESKKETQEAEEGFDGSMAPGENYDPFEDQAPSTGGKSISDNDSIFGGAMPSEETKYLDNEDIFGDAPTEVKETGMTFEQNKAELNGEILKANLTEPQLKELLTDIQSAKTEEDLGKVVKKLCKII